MIEHEIAGTVGQLLLGDASRQAVPLQQGREGLSASKRIAACFRHAGPIPALIQPPRREHT